MGITKIITDLQDLEKSLNIAEQPEWTYRAYSQLTDREIRVIQLACLGLSYKEIAAELYVSPRTVDSCRDKVFKKLGCKNMVHAVSLLYKAAAIK